MKICNKCQKEHEEPSNIIGVRHGFIWFNCSCESTLLMAVASQSEQQPRNPEPLVPSQKIHDPEQYRS